MKRLLSNAKFICKHYRFNTTKTKPFIEKETKEKNPDANFIFKGNPNEIKNVVTLFKTIEDYYKNHQIDELEGYLKGLELHKDQKIQFYVNLQLGWISYSKEMKEESTKFFEKALDLLKLLDMRHKDLLLFYLFQN